MNPLHTMIQIISSFKTEDYLIGIETDKFSVWKKVPGYVSPVKMIRKEVMF